MFHPDTSFITYIIRRFRVEGELYPSADGYRLMYDSMEQFGSDERWSLVPNDFLSYARQIAMAMVCFSLSLSLSLSLSWSLSLSLSLPVSVRAFVCGWVCGCVLAVYNKAQAEIISGD